MRHLEEVLGETSFRDGLREYLKAHTFGNATWSDLIAVLDARTPVDLGEWSRVWVESPGRPTIATELEIHAGRISRLAFRQADGRGRGLVWPQQLRVVVDQPDGPRTIAVALDGARADGGRSDRLAGAALRAAHRRRLGLRRLRARSDVARLPDASRRQHRRSADPRRGVGHAVGDDARRRRVAGRRRSSTRALAAVSAEPDEQSRARMLNYVGRRLVAAPERRRADASAPPALEKAAARRARRARRRPARRRRGSARCGAWRPRRRRWRGSARCGRKTETVAGLPLAESRLLGAGARPRGARGDRLADDSRRAARRASTTPTASARFQFIMPALSADAAVRERWFPALKDVANRRREPWVLDGLDYLHHPLRAARVGRNTCGRASTCCGRSRRPATSSSRSAGWTRRSAATGRRRGHDGARLPGALPAGVSRPG